MLAAANLDMRTPLLAALALTTACSAAHSSHVGTGDASPGADADQGIAPVADADEPGRSDAVADADAEADAAWLEAMRAAAASGVAISAFVCRVTAGDVEIAAGIPVQLDVSST